MRARYAGICGMCGRRYGIGVEIVPTPEKYTKHPFRRRWSHKTCADTWEATLNTPPIIEDENTEYICFRCGETFIGHGNTCPCKGK